MAYIIHEEVDSIVRSMGYHLVELNTGGNRKTVFVLVYVYKNADAEITSEDCEQIVFALKARVTALIYPQNLNLSVSSPGLNRVLKNKIEYPIFVNRNIRISLHTGDTVEGKLLEANEDHCTINENVYTYEQILKGRLLDCL